MLLPTAAAFAAAFTAPRGPALRRPAAAAVQPQMMLTGQPVDLVELNTIYTTTMEIAKKEGFDEFLEDFFADFPVIFTGIVLAFFVAQYIQTAKPLEGLSETIES